MKMKNIIYSIFVCVLILQTAHADEQTEIVYYYDNVGYPDGPTACAAFRDAQPQLTASPPRSWSAWQDNGSEVNPADPLEYRCRLIAYRSDGGVGSQQTRGLNIRQSSIPKEHDHADEECEALAGTVELLETDTGPSSLCAGSCAATLQGIAVSTGDDTTWWADYLYTGETCVVADPPPPPSASSKPAPPNTETTSNAPDGTVNEPHTTPDVPPADVAPPVETVAIPDSQDPDIPPGSTATVYTATDGSQITVITDSDGNVTATNKKPSTSSGTYSTSDGTTGTSTGSTDGTTGSTTEGTTGNTTGLTTDGTSGSTDGTCEGTDCGEGGDQGQASGGISCETAPICSGKQIECAIVYQTWETRCEAMELKDDLLTEVDETKFVDSSPAQQIQDDVDAFGDDLADVNGAGASQLNDAGFMDAPSIPSEFNTAGGCSFAHLSFDVLGVQIPVNDLCIYTEPTRQVLSLLIYVLTVFGVWALWSSALSRSTV